MLNGRNEDRSIVCHGLERDEAPMQQIPATVPSRAEVSQFVCSRELTSTNFTRLAAVAYRSEWQGCFGGKTWHTFPEFTGRED